MGELVQANGIASVEALVTRLLLTPAQIAERDKTSIEAGHRAHQNGIAALRLAHALALKSPAEIEAAIARARLSKTWDDERVAAAMYLTAYKILSRSATGKELGLTRNTVLSKLSRFGVRGEEIGAPKAKGGRAFGRKPTMTKSGKRTNGQAPAKRHASAPVDDAVAAAAIAAQEAEIDQVILAERALKQRAGGERFAGIARYADLHQPFMTVNSGFHHGPLHREDTAVFGLAAHEELPVVALWQANTERGRGSWTVMAQTDTRPAYPKLDNDVMTVGVRAIGKNAEGGDVYLITAKTKARYDDEGQVIANSDAPDADAFVDALQKMGLNAGADALLPTWAIKAQAIGAEGLRFANTINIDEVPADMALTDEAAVKRIGAKRAYSSDALKGIIAGLRQPGSTLGAADTKRLAAALVGPLRALPRPEEPTSVLDQLSS